MDTSQIYILASVIILAVIAIVAIKRRGKEQKPLSKLAAFAFGFVIAGIVFGEDRLIGYSLMGTGVILAVVDIVKKLKNPRQTN